jgi:hypothetical protein
MARKINRIEKAATPKTPEEIARLEEMDVQLVSLVRAGANRQRKFFVVKEDAAKDVPAADATPEDKRAAQAARSAKYEIQALEGSEANLSFPADAPTDEEFYGDPVNLKYPLGGSNNQPDVARIRNALARFKQAANVYTEEASRGLVYARIVATALAAGIDVSFDENDPVDALLPQGLKDKLKTPAGEASTAEGSDEQHAAAKTDLAAWLDGQQARVVEVALAIAGPLAEPAFPPEAPEPGDAPPAPVGKSGDAPAAENGSEVALVRKELATLQEQHTSEQDRHRVELEAVRKQLADARADAQAARAQAATIRKGLVGGSSVIPTGEVSRSPVTPAAVSAAGPEAVLCGDVAANIARQERAAPPA